MDEERQVMKVIALASALLAVGLLRGQDPTAAPPPEQAPLPPPPGVVVESPPSVDQTGEAPQGELPDPGSGKEPPREPVIPVPYGPERYASAWDNNPFTRKVAAMAQPVVNWAQDWVLLSMYNNRGKVRVSIRNRQTSEIKRLGDGSSEQEYKLVKANFHRSRLEASAEVARGSETATIKYDENAAPLTINNTNAAGNNPANGQNKAAGMPGAAPGARPPGIPAAAQNAALQAMQRQAGLPPGVTMQPVNLGAAAPQVQGASVVPPSPSTVAPPPITRRRQLIPAPIINPSPAAPTNP
jgi:hypothetical protein